MSDQSLDILIYGDPRLRERCAPVEEITDELQRQIDEMADLMYKHKGIGLAAPQVGIMTRFFICDVDWVNHENGGKKSTPNLRVMINPEIVDESAEDLAFTEGCLSIPGVEGEVYRPEAVTILYEDLDGRQHTEKIDELLARVVQHERDHLDGILFVDRMGFVKRRMLAGQLNRLKKEGRAAVTPEASM